jgi:hypothetical protein
LIGAFSLVLSDKKAGWLKAPAREPQQAHAMANEDSPLIRLRFVDDLRLNTPRSDDRAD